MRASLVVTWSGIFQSFLFHQTINACIVFFQLHTRRWTSCSGVSNYGSGKKRGLVASPTARETCVKRGSINLCARRVFGAFYSFSRFRRMQFRLASDRKRGILSCLLSRGSVHARISLHATLFLG